jgi:hypothetical protein
MKKVLFGLMALSMITVSCKDEKPAEVAAASVQPEKQPTKEEMQKAMIAYATPGKMHEWMAKSDGHLGRRSYFLLE